MVCIVWYGRKRTVKVYRAGFGYARPAWGQPVFQLHSLPNLTPFLRSSNYTILVSIAVPRPLRPAAGDGRVPGQAPIYNTPSDRRFLAHAHQNFS